MTSNGKDITADLPNIAVEQFRRPSLDALSAATPVAHAPRILIFYGSLRERSYSRFLAYEAKRLLEAGIAVVLRREAGMVHNFMLWDLISPACAAASDRVAHDIAGQLS